MVLNKAHHNTKTQGRVWKIDATFGVYRIFPNKIPYTPFCLFAFIHSPTPLITQPRPPTPPPKKKTKKTKNLKGKINVGTNSGRNWTLRMVVMALASNDDDQGWLCDIFRRKFLEKILRSNMKSWKHVFCLTTIQVVPNKNWIVLILLFSQIRLVVVFFLIYFAWSVILICF